MQPLGSNPSLFGTQRHDFMNQKLFVTEDSIIYEYDTLSLPFIDDFTSDHLPKRIDSVEQAGVRDTTLYKIHVSGAPDTDTNGYRIDSTFYYQIGSALGDTLAKIPNTVVVTVYDLNSYPSNGVPTFVFKPFSIFDTVGGSGPDTVNLPPNFVQDSVTFYLVAPDSNDWYVDRDVLINGSFPLNPPSYNVATFDGLNQYGLPYSIDFDIRVKSDQLTSLPFYLSNRADDSLYFSFYFQPKGLSLNAPEAEDSLILEFYNASTGQWGVTWSTGGFTTDTFRHVMVKVDNSFLHDGFQFRFRAYAQGAGAYDHWHVDYIYLDDSRNFDDTIYKDLAFVYPAKPILKDYYAMPWWHYKSNPSIYEAEQSSNLVRNLFDEGFNVFYQLWLLDSANNSRYYENPGSNFFRILGERDTLSLDYTINYDYKADSVKGPGKFEALYYVDFRPGSNDEKDFIRANDTLKTGICLDNYYAYDDGTAEAGYGVNPVLGSEGYVAYIAQKYEIPFPDTIGGVQLYFLPQFPDIRAQNFELMVWNNLNPGAVVFDDPVKINPIYDEDNGYITYWFDSLVVVNQSFYVGFKAVGKYSLNVGYDLNNNNRDKLFWSFNGVNWNSPSANIYDGTLMIRPIFRKKNFGVGIQEASKEKVDFDLFPNPARDLVQIALPAKVKARQLRILDLQGRVVLSQAFADSFSIVDLRPGLYIVQIELESGISLSKKLIKGL